MRKTFGLSFPFLAAGAVMVVAASALGQQAVPSHKASKPHKAGIHGKVLFDGVPPQTVILPMSSDPKCREQHPHGLEYRPIQVGAKGGLADVFVYVKSGLSGRTFSASSEKVVLDQKGCWYYPHVAGAMVGQTVEIRNSDPTMHNVNALPDFNAAMPPSVPVIDEKFSKPEVMRQLKCNVHPWMTAYVGVVDHPYFAVTSSNGEFHIDGLPPGKYTLEAWHEKLGTVTREITVPPSGEASVEFKFAKEKS